MSAGQLPGKAPINSYLCICPEVANTDRPFREQKKPGSPPTTASHTTLIPSTIERVRSSCTHCHAELAEKPKELNLKRNLYVDHYSRLCFNKILMGRRWSLLDWQPYHCRCLVKALIVVLCFSPPQYVSNFISKRGCLFQEAKKDPLRQNKI